MNIKNILYIQTYLLFYTFLYKYYFTSEMSKKAYVFDLDDTLIETNAQIYLINPEGELVKSYRTSELRDIKHKLNRKLKKGYTLRFDEVGEDEDLTYEYLLEGNEIQENMMKFMKLQRKKNKDVFILTGRGNHPSIIHRIFMEKWDIDLPMENILPIAHKDTFQRVKDELYSYMSGHPILDRLEVSDTPTGAVNKKKKLSMMNIISKGYKRIYYIDDDKDNIDEIEELKNELGRHDDLQDIEIENHWYVR
jgi:hypothetical protein